MVTCISPVAPVKYGRFAMRLLISALLLVALATPASALNQANKDTNGGVTIRPNVSAGAVLDPGDRISFQYQSARDASVLVRMQ